MTKPIVSTVTWHPAEEPPDHDKDILLAYRDGDVRTWPGYYNPEESCFVSADGGTLDPGEVTHWAEFPDHPEKKGNPCKN